MGRGDVGLNVNEEQKESNNRLIQVDNNILNDDEPLSTRPNDQRYDSALMNEVRDERRTNSNRDEDLIQFDRNNRSSE